MLDTGSISEDIERKLTDAGSLVSDVEPNTLFWWVVEENLSIQREYVTSALTCLDVPSLCPH